MSLPRRTAFPSRTPIARTARASRTAFAARIGAVTAAAATAVVLGAAPAVYAAHASGDDPSASTATASTASPDVVPLRVTADDARRALDHWTPERMAAATPTGDPAPVVAPQLPTPASHDALSASADGVPTAASPISRAEQVAPVSHIGRVFYTLNGSGFACSANVVRSGNRSTVATAAHCMTAKGNYSTDAVFVPGYVDGEAPYGRWPVVGGVVAGGYTEDNSDQADDTGFLVVARDGSGRDIASVVGASPVLFDQALVKEGTVYGYPAAGRFTGETLQRCRGVFQKEGDEQINLPCDMNEGVSGGPIFAGDDANGAQYANDDARYTDYSHILGPIWQANEHAAYDQAAAIAPAVAEG
jgi:V8-like Glu-specific endopeptidase